MHQAGWDADPTGRHQLRYHDGQQWTEHVSDSGATGVDPMAGDAPLLPPTPAGPPPTSHPQPAPISASPVAAKQKKPLWKRWWFIVGVLLVIVIAASAVAGSSEDDQPDGASDQEVVTTDEVEVDDSGTSETEDSESGETDGDTAGEPADDGGTETATTEAPDSGLPDADDGPVAVGVALQEDDDVVRVNSVTPNAPGNEFFTPDPGMTVTVAEVEACGGDDGFNANALYWSAFLESNESADNYLFADDFPTASLKPGACVRGQVSFEVPEGSAVASIVLTGPLFDETARWTVAGAQPVAERLQPVIQPEAAAVGESVMFGNGHTAVLRSATDSAPPLNEFFAPDPGRQLTQLDVEVCAGEESLPVNPLYWVAFNSEHWSGSAELGGSTLDAIDVAPGQCVAGKVEIVLPENSATAYVVLTNPIFDEVARWTTR